MTILNKMPYRNAQQFVRAISEQDTNMYVYIGRPQRWSELSDDPPTPSNNLRTEYAIWYDMTAMKRVAATDLAVGFKKINWTSGNVYQQYDDGVDLSTIDFYVVTDQNRVYKCIYTPINDVTGEPKPSTVKPTNVSSIIETTSDGYKWKFMFEITDSLMRKFAVGDYVPISFNETIINEAIVGAIESYVVENAGEGYPPDNNNIPVYVYGDGDEIATAKCTFGILSGGAINQDNVVITNPGSGYAFAPEGQEGKSEFPVLIRQITENGAVETAYGVAETNIDGQINSLRIIFAGSNYQADKDAVIVASSAQGFAVTDSAGKVIRVDAVPGSEGLNFRNAEAIVVSNFDIAALTTSTASIRPIISPFNGHGADPEKELIANYALLNMNIAYDEGGGDFTVENDFRRIGLIENPYEYGTTTGATARTLNAKRTLVVTDVSGVFSEDDIIYGQNSGAEGLFIDLIEGNKIRYVKNPAFNRIEFSLEPIRSSSGAEATVIEIQEPEVERYSGDILFINNRTPIDRSSDQIETITLVLEF